MKWHKIVALVLFAGMAFGLVAEKSYGQKEPKKKEAKKSKQSKQEKPASQALERKIPDWPDTFFFVPADKKEAKKATVFEHFRQTAEGKWKKPVMIYFFLPQGEKADKSAGACALFEKNLAASAGFKDASAGFGTYKCNIKGLEKDDARVLKSKYGVKAPQILVFDAAGKKVHAITKYPEDDKSVLKKLQFIEKASEKAAEKAYKKAEKEREKEEKKREKSSKKSNKKKRK